MERILLWCSLFFTLFLMQPLDLASGNPLLGADNFYEQGGMENYQRAIELYIEALKENPDDYEANWKCARAYREYGNEAKKQDVKGWRKICAKYGKEGMKYALTAIEHEPDKPDGNYYYGLNVGIYSDGDVGHITHDLDRHTDDICGFYQDLHFRFPGQDH